MKLVQLLAKELKGWPEGATFIVQDENKNVWSLYKGLDLSYEDSEWKSKEWFDLVLVDGIEILIDSLASDNKTSKVTQEQWKAEREKMNKPKWIRHRGGNTTLHPGTMIEARLRSGEIQRAIAGAFLWDNSLSDHAVNIMAYRIVEETKDQEIEKVKDTEVKLEMMQGDSWVTIGRFASDFGDYLFDGGQPAKGEEVKDKNLGTLTYKLEVDTSSAMTALNELSAKWDQLESPLKWRDEIIELEACEEEFRREREKLIRNLESEGFKLIDHVAPVCGEMLFNMSDWRNWKTGDIVLISNDPEIQDGEYKITRTEEYDYDGDLPIQVSDGWADFSEANVKFIRRP